MTLALFDLDNTLLNGDSDHAWGLFLADIGVVDAVEQQEKQDYFYQQYVDGKLDILEFLAFQMQPLATNSMPQLHQWRNQYVNEIVKPMILAGKADLVEQHRAKGDELVIITATNDFITRPIADELGVSNLIATTAELIDGKYTGQCAGTPCFQEGKITRLQAWLAEQEQTFNDTIFYSDSYNDLPLLQWSDTAIVVTPDDRLREHAEQVGWQIID